MVLLDFDGLVLVSGLSVWAKVFMVSTSTWVVGCSTGSSGLLVYVVAR
jgi:hypothetical protein